MLEPTEYYPQPIKTNIYYNNQSTESDSESSDAKFNKYYDKYTNLFRIIGGNKENYTYRTLESKKFSE